MIVKSRKVRKRRPVRLLTDAERHARDLNRAFKCGERYCRCGWRRRPPPRFRALLPGDVAKIETSAAFWRGYDGQTRRRNRLRGAALSWPVYYESRAA